MALDDHLEYRRTMLTRYIIRLRKNDAIPTFEWVEKNDNSTLLIRSGYLDCNYEVMFLNFPKQNKLILSISDISIDHCYNKEVFGDDRYDPAQVARFIVDNLNI